MEEEKDNEPLTPNPHTLITHTMAGRLSFAIAINLITENFRRGARQVQDTFRVLKAETLALAAALGAGGLGLTEMLGRFADVARETNRANTALRNVSGDAARYADNLAYLTRLARQYGLEVNTLTASYARFAATADISGMALADQRRIFESLSRACTAFGLSADQTGNVFTALSQMMSKGKISSEELRQQMGEQLPVALQAMARAAGVSQEGLEDLLKQGRLMSADILPRFAQALDQLIPNVSTDNLEASVNRLRNTFASLVDSTGMQRFYQRIVQLADQLLSHIRDGITSLVAFVATAIGLKLVAAIASYFQRINATIAQTLSAHQRAEQQKLLATQKRIQAEQRLQLAQTAYENAQDSQRLAAYDRLERAKTTLARAQDAERRAIQTATTAQANAAALQSSTAWGRAAARIKLALAGVATAARTALSAIGVGALITAISTAVATLAGMATEWRRIRSAYDDYQARLQQAAASNTEAVKLRNLLDIMNDRRRSQDEINAAQAALQGMLGTEKLTHDEINRRVQQRIDLLKEAARAEQAATEIAQAEGRNRQLQQTTGFTDQQMQSLMQLYQAAKDGPRQGSSDRWEDYHGVTRDFTESQGRRYNVFRQNSIDKAVAEYAQNLRILNDANARLAAAQTAAAQLQATANQTTTDRTTTTATTDTGATSSELQKQQARYTQSLRELNARRQVEGMTADEYNRALDQLNRSSLIAARATDDRELLESQYLRTLQAAVDHPAYNSAAADLAQVQAAYAEAQRTAKARLDARLITEEQYRQALLEAATSAALAAASISGIGTAADDFISRMRGVVATNAPSVEMPALGTRDTTFDYKKTPLDIRREELQIWVEYRDNLEQKKAELKQRGMELGSELQKQLDTAIAQTSSLEDALKLAEVQEDIETFRTQLAEGVYSGIKDVASNADRMVSAFRNISEVMNDADASPWEKILAVWNAMVQTVDGFMSIIHIIENISALTAKLSGAQQSSDDIVAGKSAEMAANLVATATEIALSKQKTEAAVLEMAAKSTAAYAGIPFVGAGLAAAQIAAMTALIEGAKNAVPKFAGGGIVTGGPTSGDKILARVNAGEMILNPAQQSNLFRMIDEGRADRSRTASGVVIGFDKVRGSDIYLSLKNYMKSTGKRL